MLKDFILNTTLLISFFAISGQILKNVPNIMVPSTRVKVGMGLGLGLLGVILMKFSINVTPTLIADIRHLAIIIAALYGGLTASIITSGVIVIGRITLFSWSDATIIVSLNMILIGIVCGFLSRTSISYYLKAIIMNIISFTMITVSFYLIIEDINILLELLPYHSATSLIGGWFAFHLVEYILQSNDATRRLKESEERYRRLVVLSPDPILIHDGKAILFANDKATRLVSATDYNDIVNKSIFDFVHPNDHSVIINRIQKMDKDRNEAGITEIKIISLTGRLIDIEISDSYVSYKGKPAYQVLFRDITERKKMETDLKESEERYRFIADNSTDLISILSTEGIYLYTSPACKRLIGYGPDQLVGQSCFDFIHADDVPKIVNLFREAMDDDLDFTAFHYRFVGKDGLYRWHEATARTIRKEDGTIHQILAISRDITERKRKEEELVESNLKLQQLSTLDGLTGIPNRRFFDDRLKMEWIRSVRASSRISLIMIDIDYFKSYNDTYGHQGGDDCLIKVAHCLQETLNRSSDFAARYGGEEFVVILPDTDPKGASIVAEGLRKKIEELEIPHVGSVIANHVTISLGIASTIPHFNSDPQGLIGKADKALYLAKQEGRNRCKIFS